MAGANTENLSKLQIICSLFSEIIGDDLYFAKQIKESIEASLDPTDSRTEPFVSKARELLSEMNAQSRKGIRIVHAMDTQRRFSILQLRIRLLDATKAVCRYDEAVIVITGLKEAICPDGRRWTQARESEYREAISFSREFCQQRSRPSAKLSLIIL